MDHLAPPLPDNPTGITELQLRCDYPEEWWPLWRQLSEDASRYQGLWYLDIAHTLLRELPGDLDRFGEVEHLCAAGNLLSDLPMSVARLTRLTWLDVSLNRLARPPAVLSQLVSLEELILSENPVEDLAAWSEVLATLPRLERVALVAVKATAAEKAALAERLRGVSLEWTWG